MLLDKFMPNPLPNNKPNPVKINLIPQEGAATSTPGRFVNWLLTAGRYLLIITELLLFSAFISRFYFDDRIQDEIDKGIRPKLQTIKYLEKNEADFKNLQSRINNIKAGLNSRLDTGKILEEIINLTPEGVVLDRIELDGSNFSFNASLPNIEKLAVFQNNFAKSSIFRTLDISDLSSAQETGLITFKAVSALKSTKTASRAATVTQ